MSGPDRSENFDALRDLADARFHEWCSRELRSESDSRFSELNKKKLTGGRALQALRITEELLTLKVQKRISLYHSVARKHHSGEMLSKPRLDELREGIMRSVGASLSSLRSRTGRQASAVGHPQSALPSELRYDHVRAEILTIVNTALARLNAEGNAHPDLPDRSVPVAPIQELNQESSAAAGDRAVGRSQVPATLSPAERLRQLAAHPFIRDTETRASLEFHRCAHENQAKWWVIEKQAYLIYPRNPSEEELLEALQNPAEILDATLGEMAAANYAATIIEPIVIGAMASIQGPELETFIQECIRTYTEKACKLLRPASENEESRNRVGHFIDLAVTTALTSIRMVSHLQAGIKNGMAWEDLARLVPRRSALPDNEGLETPPTDADHAGTEAEIPTARPPADQSIPFKRMDGSVEWINPDAYGVDPPGTIWTRDNEERISTCVTTGRAEVRRELERIFAENDWPEPSALIESLRLYAVKVFDVYASAYQQIALSVDGYQEALDQRLLPMVLRDLFGREWDRAPGENVVRTVWHDGPDGKLQGEEVEVVARNDPDPTCVYYELLSNAMEFRYRFLRSTPQPAPGEPPGINLPDENWWRYIGLNERHNIAMAIKPYLEDRVAHWRFIYVPTVLVGSENADDRQGGDASRQAAHQEPGTRASRASMAARASLSSDAIAMESLTRIKFETGLALAEVTLDQDLKDDGPSLEIAQKYVTNATLTLARCILTPNCEEPYESIRRAYDFAEWFAAEAMKTAWVWLCVFSEMEKTGKSEKYKRDRKSDEGTPTPMSESEMREWHGCLFGVAHEALDEFVPGFWKDRLKHFSDTSGGDAPAAESATSSGALGDPGALAQDPPGLRVNSNAPKRDAKPQLSNVRKGDATLLGEKLLVSFGTAEQYLGLTERQRQKLMKSGALKVEGRGLNRKITTESLRAYLRPEIPN